MSAGQGHTRGILAKENEVVWDADRSGLRRCSEFEAGSGMATDEAQPTEYLILRGLQESWLAQPN